MDTDLELELLKASLDEKCYKCGGCCRRRACCYGVVGPRKGYCRFLTDDNLCSKKDEIMEMEKDSKISMFWGGCSGTLFNTARDNKIKELAKKRNG